jgi:anti-sigma regulatory factor (Ser/Thr protein kinase)
MRPNQQPAADAAGRGPAAPVRLAVLAVPAAEEHVALARLAALQVAAAVGLEPGRAADLGLAVGEACGLFLAAVPPGSPARRRAAVTIRFERAAARLRVTARGPVTGGWPDKDGFGWLLLSALVGDLHWTEDGGVGTLTLVEHLPAPDGFGYAAF